MTAESNWRSHEGLGLRLLVAAPPWELGEDTEASRTEARAGSHKVRPRFGTTEVPSYSSSPSDEDRETYRQPQGLGPVENQ
jgi:hypothetical protein